MALSLPQPKILNGGPDEVKERLAEATANANRALTLIEKSTKQSTESDDQFQQRKNSMAADAHLALGMVEMQQDRFDLAVARYKAAISLSGKPGVQNYYNIV